LSFKNKGQEESFERGFFSNQAEYIILFNKGTVLITALAAALTSKMIAENDSEIHTIHLKSASSD
jgi:hypothetical protein